MAPQHEVQVLNGNARGSFDQIIKAGEDHHPAPYDAQGDVAEVGVRRIFGRGQVADYPHERTLSVERTIEVHEVVLDGRATGMSVDRGEDAPVHGHKMRGENDLNRFAPAAGR